MRRIGLIFSYKMTTQEWQKCGVLLKEYSMYSKYIKYFIADAITWFTYDTPEMLTMHHPLIKVVPMPREFEKHKFWYSLLLPIVHADELSKCDILMTTQMRGAWTAMIAKFILHKPVVLRMGYIWSANLEARGKFIMAYLVKVMERFFSRCADKVVVTTTKGAEHMDKSKIMVLHSFVNTSEFVPQEGKKDGVVYVGRLSEEKNIINLVRAVKYTGIKLDIYGAGPMQEEIQSVIGDDKNITLKGAVDNNMLPKILPQYKIFVLPSFHEGCPKALIEAMSCGLACIGSDIDGIREIIKHGYNGLLCGIDAVSIRKTVVELLSNNWLRERVGIKARKTVEMRYSFESQRKNLDKIFEGVK